MAVINGNYKLTDEQMSQRSERLIGLVKEMIVVESFDRNTLESVMNEMKEQRTAISSTDVDIVWKDKNYFQFLQIYLFNFLSFMLKLLVNNKEDIKEMELMKWHCTSSSSSPCWFKNSSNLIIVFPIIIVTSYFFRTTTFK